MESRRPKFIHLLSILLLLTLFSSTPKVMMGQGCSPCEALCASSGGPFHNCDCGLSSYNFCSGQHFSQFYAYCPEQTNLSVTMEVCDCYNNVEGFVTGGIEVFSYIIEDGDCNNPVGVWCAGVPSTQSGVPNGNCHTYSYTVPDQTPGQIHVFQVDGWNHDCCYYTFSIDGVNANPAIDPIEFSNNGDPINLCIGNNDELSIVSTAECAYLEWDIISGQGVIDIENDEENVIIYGLSGGTAELCATANNFCANAEQACVEINVSEEPRLDDIEPIISCAESIDFCDYLSFFNPPLNPDPINEGWDFSFHTDYFDAENNENPIDCIYDLSNSDFHTIYIRTSLPLGCHSITSFEIIAQRPNIEPMEDQGFCTPIVVDLSSIFIPVDRNGLNLINITYHLSEIEADEGVGAIIPPILDEAGTYEIWVRAETEYEGCFDVELVNLEIVQTPQIEILPPILPCWQEGTEIDLSQLDCDELTNTYDCDETDDNVFSIRWYDYEPDPDDLDFYLNPPIATEEGRYCAVGIAPNILIEDYENCPSEPVCIDLEASETTTLQGQILEIDCAGADITILFSTNSITGVSFQYAILDEQGQELFRGTSYISEDVSPNEEYVNINADPAPDSLCLEITNLVLDDPEACIPEIDNGNCAIFPKLDTLRIREDQNICRGNSATLIFDYTGDMPIDIVYSDGITDYNINNLEDGHIEQVSPTVNTQYTIISANQINGCDLIILGSAIVDVSEPLRASVAYECIGGTQYRANIEISGGAGSGYLIDGMPISSPPNNHQTGLYPSGSANTLIISDSSSCDDIEVSLSRNCNCTNSPGTMQLDLLEVCMNDTAFAFHNQDEITLSDDQFYFILHTNSGTSIGNIIDSNQQAIFTFNPTTMATGQTYYVSAISGNDDGTGTSTVDRNDPCMQISAGQPIIFHDLPTGLIDSEFTACVHSEINIPIEFTGRRPFNIIIDTNNIPFDTLRFNTNSGSINIPLGNNDVNFVIRDLTDGLNCASGQDRRGRINITPPIQTTWAESCNATNTAYTITFNLSGGSGNYLLNNNPIPNPYTTSEIPSGEGAWYIFNDDLGCGPDSTYVEINCLCDTDAGELEPSNLDLCINESGEITVSESSVLDPDDAFGYMIYTSRNAPYASRIYFGDETTISFDMLDAPIEFELNRNYFISPVAANDDSNGFIDYLNDECVSIGEPIRLIWRDIPSLLVDGPAQVCDLENAFLNLNFSGGNPPFSTDISVNGNPLNIMSLLSEYQIRLDSLETMLNYGSNSMEFSNIRNLESCIFDTTITLNFEYLEPIQAQIDSMFCNASQEAYQVTITIEGGQSPYIINGRTTLGPFTSEEISNGDQQIFIITDSTGCSSDTIISEMLCNCPSPGIINGVILELCGAQTVDVSQYPNSGLELFDGDTSEYILHNLAGSRRGQIIDRSFDGVFEFDPNQLDYGTTYYISRMVGNIGPDGLIDTLDPCSRILAAGIPVTWYEEPLAIIDPVENTILSCADTIIQLSARSATPLNNIDIRWINRDKNDTIRAEVLEISEPGMYVLMVNTLESGCFAFDSIQIGQDNDRPAVNLLIPDTITCLLPSVRLSDISGTSESDFSYTWLTPDGERIETDGPTLVTSNAGLYELIIENTLSDCRGSSTVHVTEDVTEPVVDAGMGGIFDCHTQELLISGDASSNSGSVEILWYLNGDPIEGADESTILIDEAGWYALEAIDLQNGCKNIDSVEVTVDGDFPTDALINAFDPLCAGDDNGYVSVDSVIGGALPYEYSINGGDFTQNPNFYDLNGGDYELVIRDQNGCSWSTVITLEDPAPIFVDLGQDTTIFRGDTIEIVGNIGNYQQTGEGQSNIDSIRISFVDSLSCQTCPRPSGVISPDQTTEYQITIISSNGCVATASRRVQIVLNRPYFIPNSFTPNGDGINDFVSIHLKNIDQIESIQSFSIFDRWGNQVYLKEKLEVGESIILWDGKIDGVEANPNVFVYTVKLKYKDGYEMILNGDITLLR